MRIITYIILYITLSMLYYTILSSIGLTFGHSFKEIYQDKTWFMIYLLFFHWWLVIFSLKEYYDKYLQPIL
jgi:hypothetical protein